MIHVVLGGLAAPIAGVVALAGGVVIWALPAHPGVRRAQHGRHRADDVAPPLSRPSP
jgi:hypothetical protein